MTSDMENPALATRGVPNSSRCWQACDGSEHTESAFTIQDFRAAWIARRSRIPLHVAATLAPLAFGMEGAR